MFPEVTSISQVTETHTQELQCQELEETLPLQCR